MADVKLRNIAIIAHVDHGKTTLVDGLLRQTESVAAHKHVPDRAMDRLDLEQERGITILAKNTAVTHQGHTINIVDTPGHSDFGGEVERVLGMVDSVLLLVDAYEGPMPQTRFVLRKALERGLCPIVVINKVDRPDARPDTVLDAAFDLFVALDANEDQLDFPILYASAKERWAAWELDAPRVDLMPLLDAVIARVPAPQVDLSGPFQMQVATLGYNDFVGRIAVGRVQRGSIGRGETVGCVSLDGELRTGRISKLTGYEGLAEVVRDEVSAGDIVGISGITDAMPGETLCEPAHPEALPPISVDEPTVSVEFRVNDGPFAGKEGKYVTSRNIRDRLDRELQSNVALRVEEGESTDVFVVYGRGELHLTVLIETMRREGYELMVSQPRVVVQRDASDRLVEPYEDVAIECGDEFTGAVIEDLGKRGGELLQMQQQGDGMTRLQYNLPSRGLIGYRSRFLTQTRGTGTLYHTFSEFGPHQGAMPERAGGAMCSIATGRVTTYALETLQERGTLLVEPGDEVYCGQVCGEHQRGNELPINPTKARKLDNMRSATKEIDVRLNSARKLSLEESLEFITSDELVEVTPTSIRLRKRILDASERKREKKKGPAAS